MRQGGKNYSDMGHSLFLNSTCDIEENKRQGHATLPFLKFNMRHWGPQSRAPIQTQTILKHIGFKWTIQTDAASDTVNDTDTE